MGVNMLYLQMYTKKTIWINPSRRSSVTEENVSAMQKADVPKEGQEN